jgi:hypothetical protein
MFLADTKYTPPEMQRQLDALVASLSSCPSDAATQAALSDFIMERAPRYGVADCYPMQWIHRWRSAPRAVNATPRGTLPDERRAIEFYHGEQFCREAGVPGARAGVVCLQIGWNVPGEASADVVRITGADPYRVHEVTRWLQLPAAIVGGDLVWFAPVLDLAAENRTVPYYIGAAWYETDPSRRRKPPPLTRRTIGRWA